MVAVAFADHVVVPRALIFVAQRRVFVDAEQPVVLQPLDFVAARGDDAAAVDRRDDLDRVEAEARDVAVAPIFAPSMVEPNAWQASSTTRNPWRCARA